MKKQFVTLLATLQLATAVPAFAEVTPFEIGDSNFTRTDSIDISGHQKWLEPEDFVEFKNRGVQSIITKATEATTFFNEYMKPHTDMAMEAGLSVGVYHYSHYYDEESARAEALTFISYLEENGFDKNTLLFNDLEDKNTYIDLTEEEVVHNTRVFFDTLKENGYTNVGLYTYQNYRYRAGVVSILGEEDTWIAQYPNYPEANGPYENEWREVGYGGWQYASSGMFKGHRLDTNIDYNGLLTLRTNLPDGTNWDTETNSRTGETAEEKAEREAKEQAEQAQPQTVEITINKVIETPGD